MLGLGLKAKILLLGLQPEALALAMVLSSKPIGLTAWHAILDNFIHHMNGRRKKEGKREAKKTYL